MESESQNVLDLISFFPWTKSDVVSRWRTLGIHGFGPQSTSLTFHAFHMQSNLPLIHVSISENDNEHTSWCSINSSNVSNTIMVKDCFTCESKVANVVVSRHVMSSSDGFMDSLALVCCYHHSCIYPVEPHY